jgi:flagellar M-ring protein FliF
VLEQLKQRFSQFSLRGHYHLLLISVLALLITGIVMMFLWRGTQNYTALFGAQEKIPVAQVVEVLSGESIDYRVNPVDGQILVAENNLSKARMALASKGISAAIPVGYELMDKETMLGSSQFMQNVRYKRSLEGELAQSVMTLGPVLKARVHLGITDSSSFVINNKPDSSASVIVSLHYGQSLTDEQIGAIIHLVSGSVPGLNTERVQVVDDAGRLLSNRYQADAQGVMSMRSGSELTQRIQKEIENNVAHLLLSLVGSDNYRISVMPQVDLSKIEETQERYGVEPKVNNESIQQENVAGDVALGVPGALSNRPANQNAANAAAEPTAAGRSQIQRQYSYDRDIRHIKHPGFKVEKVSVAVILNADAAALEGWDEARLAQLNQLISDAAGINRERGDSLTVNMMHFTAPPVVEETVVQWWQEPTIMRWVELGGIGLLALILLIFGINPLLRRIAGPKAAGSHSSQDDGANSAENAEQGAAEQTAGIDLPKSAFHGDDNLPPQSSGLETKIEYLQLLAETETERVAEVIKQWINSNSAPAADSTASAPKTEGQS